MTTRQCSKCEKVYPYTLKNFPYLEGQCRTCRRAYEKRYRKEHREQIAAQQKKYQKEHREDLLAYKREYYRAHRKQRTAQQKKYNKAHREQIKTRQKEYQRQLRLEVLNHYTPKGLRCACCGEDHVEFLCIDHVNGGGGKHRRRVGGGSSTYRWLKRHSFPSGFQVLCANCNMSLGLYGFCPHRSSRMR